MTSVRLKGFKGIDKALDKMARTVRSDVLERVAEDSADRMLADYKAGTHPTIRRGVRVRTVDKRADKVAVAVGSRHPLVAIFEFGTRRRQTAAGSARGRITPMGFARRAFDKNVSSWFRDTGRLLWNEVKRAGN